MVNNLIKIWELIVGTSLQDGHELPVSEGVGAGKTKRYTIAQLKAHILIAVNTAIVAIAQGPQGNQGTPGVTGNAGAKGDKGDKGDVGSQGIKGNKGDVGGVGIAGPTGATGVKGDKGDTGVQGVAGAKGDTGDVGATGSSGAEGLSAYAVALSNGFVGTEAAWLLSLKGADGAAGAKGDKGDIGNTGAIGATGAAGTNGTDGAAGAQGIQGVKGDTGATGANGTNGAAGSQGIQGIKGDTGATGTSDLPTGGTSLQYFAGDKTLKDFATAAETQTQTTPASQVGKMITLFTLIGWFNWLKGQIVNVSSTWSFTKLLAGTSTAKNAHITAAVNTTTNAQANFAPSAADYTGTESGAFWNNTSEFKFYDATITGINRFLKLFGNAALVNSATLSALTKNAAGDVSSLAINDAFVRIATAIDYTVVYASVGFAALIAVTNTSVARTITLPLASTYPAGTLLRVVDESGAAATNNITITRVSTDVINGASTTVINTNYGKVQLYSDGVSKWFII